MNAVELRGVTKTFGSVEAVREVSLDVPEGSIYGFLGPNGSGKTTTLRMIMRILHPDRGDIKVLGEQARTAANNRVGYLPEERGLYRHMKVREVLRFFAELKGMRQSGPAIKTWLERLDLAGWANQKVSALSKGMAQKVQFIATVIASPALVLLDEPFSGLDPVNSEVFREVVLELKRRGTTIIFSTHDMSTAEKMCDFLFMIYRGRKVLDGTLAEIQNNYGTDTVRVRMAPESGSLAGLPGVTQVVDYGQLQELRLAPGADSQSLLAAILTRGPVVQFEHARPSLHDIFVRIARPQETPEAASA
ncbi:MAG TPA: ATP-binding cassette domain-containing protein [Isosphaeraceae bacterium]|nr:ATP-binding cassette domain-containing protein [Isosphaeraceae bacterium]